MCRLTFPNWSDIFGKHIFSLFTGFSDWDFPSLFYLTKPDVINGAVAFTEWSARKEICLRNKITLCYRNGVQKQCSQWMVLWIYAASLVCSLMLCSSSPPPPLPTCFPDKRCWYSAIWYAFRFSEFSLWTLIEIVTLRDVLAKCIRLVKSHSRCQHYSWKSSRRQPLLGDKDSACASLLRRNVCRYITLICLRCF